MTVTAEAQTAIDERTIDSSELEAMLEEREEKKAAAAEARRAYAAVNELVQAEFLERLEDGEVGRIGRFRIRRTSVPSRSVSFVTDPTSRLAISVTD